MSRKNASANAVNNYVRSLAEQGKTTHIHYLPKGGLKLECQDMVAYRALLSAALNNPRLQEARMEISALLGQNISSHETVHLSLQGRDSPLGARISRQGRPGLDLLEKYGFNERVMPRC